MANRILLDENGLKISKPGVDVLTAGLAGLQFTSVGTHVPRFTTGTLSAATGSGDTPFLFGKTFPAAPIVTWYSSSAGFGGAGPIAVYQNPFGLTQMRWQLFIQTDRLILRMGAEPSVTLHFKVWDFG